MARRAYQGNSTRKRYTAAWVGESAGEDAGAAAAGRARGDSAACAECIACEECGRREAGEAAEMSDKPVGCSATGAAIGIR